MGAHVFSCKCVRPNKERDPRPRVYCVCARVYHLCVCEGESGKDLEIVRNARQGFCPNNSVVACVDVSDR